MRFRMASSAADAARHRQRVIEWANPSPPYAALHESGSGTKRTYRDVRYLSVTAPGAIGIGHLRPVSWIIPTKPARSSTEWRRRLARRGRYRFVLLINAQIGCPLSGAKRT